MFRRIGVVVSVQSTGKQAALQEAKITVKYGSAEELPTDGERKYKNA